jgi:predicted O-linked N-acetylglucosamine transferase (SPINDLY family)
MIPVRQALDAAWQHYRAGEWPQAEQIYLRVLEEDPVQFDALNLLAVIAAQTGREDLAIDYLRKVLQLRPDWAAAHSNLGGVFAGRKRFPEAVACFREAVRLQPDLPEAHNNLGNALREDGRPAEATASLAHAIRIRPDYAEAYQNLGLAWFALERFDDAIAALRTAIRLKPNLAAAWLTLGNALREQGQLDRAIDAYRRAIEIEPGAAGYHSSLVFILPFHPDHDSAAVLDEARRWSRRHAEPLERLAPDLGGPPDPGRRLRIGYVSPDFRNHVQAIFTTPLLSHHDREQVEVFCYADVARPDARTERLRGHADAWRNIVGLSDLQLAELVRDDRIDILVDLTMHMHGNRLPAFARRPAPIQVTWLAYPGTTGLSAIDYRLTDPYLDPPGLFETCYAEESVRLETFWCYDPLTDGPPVNALPAAASGVVTFGCLNHFSKVNDGCLALWADVLRAVPRSRLLLMAPPGEARGRVAAGLERAGVAATRVEFVGRTSRADYLGLYHRIDLGLDPAPYNGHTTSLDASWMGVPTVTLVSRRTAVGRAGWSQLCNLGLPELAAETPAEYVAIAARLAGEPSRLQEWRGTLRQRMRQSPLMDAPRFARQMEQAYRAMWHRWCRNRRWPEPD